VAAKSLQVNLVGAPGSGKTTLAQALFDPLYSRGYKPLRIIDGCHLDIEERYDLATGMGGGWLADLAMAIERIGQQRAAQAEGIENFIVCGGIAEAAVHTAINAEISGDQYAYQVATTVTPLYPLLRMSLGIHPTFLLPWADDEVIFHRAVDSQMTLSLEALNIQFYTLPPAIEDQVEYVLKVLDDSNAEDQE
jgi:hypothetical protein